MSGLECVDVRKHYGGVVALRGVDLAVRPGEIVGLIGANGAGKSTLIDIIGGEQTSFEGATLLDGAPIAGPPSKRARAGIARTFQRPKLALELTLRENVAVGLACRELGTLGGVLRTGFRGLVSRRAGLSGEVEAACGRVGLRDLDRAADQASFGEWRLVEVARALVQRPQVVMLDEPYPGVGDEGIAGITVAMRMLRDDGCAVLLVDHNIDIVAAAVDRMALLAQGAIAVEGAVERCMRSDVFRSTYIGVA
jgi:branched-chain amino acid transport system ATP-binding protein